MDFLLDFCFGESHRKKQFLLKCCLLSAISCSWRNIKGFSVSSLMVVVRLAVSERLTQVCGSQTVHAPKQQYSVSVFNEDAHLPVAI